MERKLNTILLNYNDKEQVHKLPASSGILTVHAVDIGGYRIAVSTIESDHSDKYEVTFYVLNGGDRFLTDHQRANYLGSVVKNVRSNDIYHVFFKTKSPFIYPYLISTDRF